MKEQPLVSVITVTLNIKSTLRESFFKQCLDSVSTQTYKYIEHIVIDGGSTDGTVEILQNCRNIRYISEPDSGIYDAMNKGIAIAKGKYITFLNSDDFYNSESGIEESVLELENKNADFSYAPIHVITPDGMPLTPTHYHENPIITNVFFHMPFSHQSMLIKKTVFDKIGTYDTQFKNAGDYDLALRICLNDFQCVLVSNSFVTYRTQGISEMNSSEGFEEVQKIFLKNYGELANITPLECKNIYANGLTRIPSDLAAVLKEHSQYFDFDEYVKLMYLELESYRTKEKSWIMKLLRLLSLR